MTDQEIRAKALECAIATIAALPETNRTAYFVANIEKQHDLTQAMTLIARQFASYIEGNA